MMWLQIFGELDGAIKVHHSCLRGLMLWRMAEPVGQDVQGLTMMAFVPIMLPGVLGMP